MSTIPIPSIEYGVFDLPLHLPTELEPQRESLRGALLAAQRRLRDFAARHGWWVHVEQPFAKRFQVYADKPAFDRDLLELCNLDVNIELPATYCAALEQGVLLSISPELYRALYPEGDEAHAFEKLLCHEMAHRLHIRLLSGDEDAMGAVWFYEGFALYAAGQFETNAPVLQPAEIWEIVSDPERGSYRRYAAVFQHFARLAALPELVARASRADFVDWLKYIGC